MMKTLPPWFPALVSLLTGLVAVPLIVQVAASAVVCPAPVVCPTCVECPAVVGCPPCAVASAAPPVVPAPAPVE